MGGKVRGFAWAVGETKRLEEERRCLIAKQF
jgi:hypothetical protein